MSVDAKTSSMGGPDSAQDAAAPRQPGLVLATLIIAVVLGAALVFFVFPKHDKERALLLAYHQEDLETAAEAG